MQLRTYSSIIVLAAFGIWMTACETLNTNSTRKKREISVEITDTIAQISAPTSFYFDSLAIDSFMLKHPRLERFAKAYRDFYKKRNWQFVWYTSRGLSETAYGLTAHLMSEGVKDSSGLPYQQELDQLMNPENRTPDASPDTETEFLLTGMYFHYTEKLLSGVDESVSRKLGWFIPRRKISMPALLDSFLVAKNWDDFEKNALNAQYFKLRDALNLYKNIEKSGAEVIIPLIKGKPERLKPGVKADPVTFIRKRLMQLGYASGLVDTSQFLPDMAGAVNLAKRAYGMKEDTIIDNTFIRALNVPARERQKQLLVNMERLRWIPARIQADELILVNIPEFKLHYYQKGKPEWTCKVVVGTPVHKTVIFSGVMDYVVFSPYWYVPTSIIRNEIGVARAKSASYLRSHNMEWSGGQLREKPGPRNSLGLVKFIFPNSNSIYLHDTPSKYLFEKETRAFSHGCIRVSEPFMLAKKVLAYDSSWTDEKIKAAMHAGVERRVVLERKIPVYIGYFTAFADQDGLIHFRNDVYQRDDALFESLSLQ